MNTIERPLANRLSILRIAIAAMLAVSNLPADDWPQWMGPQRDNVWREDGIIERFPDNGLTPRWTARVAGGYSGPAVADGRVVLTDYVTTDDVKVDNFDRKEFSGNERVLCLKEATGEQLWMHEYPVTYGISYPSGPRCTPVIHQGLVYTLGAEGQLLCLHADSGNVVWSKNLPRDYSTKTALWGYASHPLIDGDKLICIVGGDSSHAVAFDRQSGRELWRTLTSAEQGYSPPTIIEAAGVRQLILFHPQGIASVNPESGEPYWRVPYEATNGSAIMSPLQSGEFLYAAGYSNKNILLRLAKNVPQATVVWQDLAKHGVCPVNVQPCVADGTMYGFDQNGLLYAATVATGQRLWETGKPLNSERPVPSGSAFMVRNAGQVWMFNEQGELIIARFSPAGYEEIDRTKVLEPTNNAFGRKVVWSTPAWANRRVYIRSDQECVCLDLAGAGPGAGPTGR